MVWIFPLRNLPDEAIPWAREIENQTQSAETENSSAQETVNNVSRAFSSQLAVQAGQINELYDRSISEFSMPIVNATQASPGNSSVIVPSPTYRAGMVTLNSEFSYSGGTGNGFITLYQDGVIRARALGIITQNPPAGWPQGAVSMGFGVTIPPGGSTFTARIEVVQFSGTLTVTSVDMKLNVYYGNKV